MIEGHDYWYDTAEEAEEFLKTFDERSLELEGAKNENESNTESEQNSVQDEQSEAVEQGKTDDNQDKGNDSEAEEVTDKSKSDKAEESVTIDNVAEKYPEAKDSRGVLKALKGIKAEDKPTAKEYNSKLMKNIIDDILQRYNDGKVTVAEALGEIQKLISAYTDGKPFAPLAADNNHSSLYGVKEYMRETKTKLKEAEKTEAADKEAKRTDAITKAQKETQAIVDEFKTNTAKTPQDVQKEIEDVKSKLELALKELGAKPLTATERKNAYDNKLKIANAIQTSRDVAAETARQKEIREKAKAEAAEKTKKEKQKAEKADKQDAQAEEDSSTKMKQEVKSAVDEAIALAEEAAYGNKETGEVDQDKKNEYDNKITELTTSTRKHSKELADVLKKLAVLAGKIKAKIYYRYFRTASEDEKAAFALAPEGLYNEVLEPEDINLDALGLELDEQAKDDIAVNGVAEAVLEDYAEDAEGAVVQKLLEDLEADEVESLDVCKAVAQRLQKVLKKREAIYDKYYVPIDTAKEYLRDAMIEADINPPKSLDLVQLLVTNNRITGKVSVPIIDVTNLPQVNINSSATRKSIVKDLVNNSVTFSILGAGNVGRVASVNDGEHLVYGSNPRNKYDKTRKRALSAITEILNNSVYVDKHSDAKHASKVKYIDCYAAIKDKDTIYRIKIVAKELNKNAGLYEVSDAGIYDILKEGSISIAPPIRSGEKNGILPSSISIADLLRGVKDRQGNYYVDGNGNLNYDSDMLRAVQSDKAVGQQLINLIQNAGIEVITDKAEIKRVLGESLNKAAKDDAVQKLIISYREGEQAPDLTITKQNVNGKDMYGVAFVGEKPKNYVPKKIGKAYKLMEMYPDGTLHALFAGVEKAHKIGEWNWAQGFTPEEKGAVKTMNLAPRYGWHMGTGVPASYHLMGVGDTLAPRMVYPTKSGIGHPKGSKRVWVEVHYDATNDYTDIAERNPSREKDIRGLIPFGGYYMFQEGNLSNWIIASGIKFDHVLSEEERNKILDNAGYNEELVWRKQVLAGKLKAQITSDNKKLSGEKALGKAETLESVQEHKRKIEGLVADNEARIKELNDGKDWKYKKRSEADLAAERAKIRKEVFDNPEIQNAQFLKASHGEVYGFVKDGKVYIDPDLLNANTPIHEYTHIWDDAVKQRNPQLWAKGVELLKQTSLWSEVVNDPLYADIKEDEDLVASEVHARLSGEKGANVLKKAKAPKGVLGALKKWLSDFWTFLKDTFAEWSGEDLAKLSLDDFVAMPIGDLVKGTKLGAKTESKAQYSVRQKSQAQDPGITGINNQYKEELEKAYAEGANNNKIAAIMNAHQQELSEYMQQAGEAKRERNKIRAAQLRQDRKDFKEGKIDSYTVGGVTIVRGKDGAEVVKEVTEKLPTRKYTNERHAGEKPANATQKLGSIIARPEEKSTVQKAKGWITELKDNFYKHWVDKYDALSILDGAIADADGNPINPADTILGRTQMVTNAASGAARALIDGDAEMLKQLAGKYKIKNMVSLQMLMEKIGAARDAGKFADYVKSSNTNGSTSLQSYIDAVENYLVARSALESAQNHRLDYDRTVAEWEEKGGRGKKPEFKEYKFPGGMTEAEVVSVIRSAPAEFKEYAKMFKGITDNMLDVLYNSGLITGERYLAIKDRYKAYCPLMRDFSDTAAVDSFIDQINGGKGIGNVSDPLKSRSSEGSERDIVPPLATIIKSINALTMKAERNRVGQYAVRQAKKHRLDNYIKEVEGSSGDSKNCIFTVVIDGKKHSYQTIPELYPAITAAVEPLMKVEMALLTKPAQLLRTGSTMSPSFIIRNFLRDTLFAAVSTKNGFVPIYDSIRGAYALLHNKQLRGEFMSSGVVSSNFYGDGESIMRSLNDMAGGKKWEELSAWEIVKAVLGKPIQGLEWTSNLIEQSTRMGEFMKAREKGKSVEQAAYDAVEITLNFNRSGATGQQINRMVPFFNACVQGGDKLYRLFKADPKTTLLRIGVYMVLPSLVLWLMNHDEDWYKELDPNIKMQNWILPGGIRIPKPQEAGVLFGSGFEAALDTANGQDPKAMKAWSKAVLDNLTPGIFPTLILPLLEWQANYSFFRGKPVVSKAQERLPDELQYGPYTSEASKAIGSIAGISPAKLDNLWRGYTGTMGMALWQAPDLLVAEKRNLPEKKLSEMAVVRDFVINDMNLNRTMNDFYALSQAATQWQAGYGKKGKPTVEVSGINTAARTIAKLQKEARNITSSPKYNSTQKRILVDKLQAKQRKIAELCIKKYGSKFNY